nr:MAG TPA_asm: peptidase [Caudoviricetes sp.]
MKILVTGFDLWSGVSINPSWENIKDLPTKVSGHTIKVAKISVVYSKIKNEMETLITTEKPDLIISFGLASSIQRPRVESYGWNWASNGSDADGVNPNGRLNKEDNARVGYKTTYDYTQVQEWIKGSEFTSYASADAGDFLCNANIFYSLQKLDKDLLNTPYMFVHVPSETTMALDIQKKFVKLIIQKAVQELNQSLDWSTATSGGTTTTPTTPTNDGSTGTTSIQIQRNLLNNVASNDINVSSSSLNYRYDALQRSDSGKYGFKGTFVNNNSTSVSMIITVDQIDSSEKLITLKPGTNNVELTWNVDGTSPSIYFSNTLRVKIENYNGITVKSSTLQFGKIS